jgi:uncharacterized protein (DUF1697 family)
MTSYTILLRGINVGGKNKLSMATLKECLAETGFSDVATYINSGNVVLSSDRTATQIKSDIETLLPKKFKLDSELIKVLVLNKQQLQAVVDNKPNGFGESPDTYHSDIIFLIDFDVQEALTVFNPREGVDAIWPGEGVIYSQRLSEMRTKSRLGKIIGTVPYQSMTIRTWGTTVKLLALLA